MSHFCLRFGRRYISEVFAALESAVPGRLYSRRWHPSVSDHRHMCPENVAVEILNREQTEVVSGIGRDLLQVVALHF
jgi:hypothetical protein